MAEEFTIKSTAIEDKINQLLPSQGGFQPGIDFSASTMVIPVVDLTETAEGSSLRADLQSALSHNSATPFNVSNTTTTVLNTTGYWRITCSILLRLGAAGTNSGRLIVNDGTTDKVLNGLYYNGVIAGTNPTVSENYDFIIKLDAGDSFKVQSTGTVCIVAGSARQLADLSGNLVNP